MPPLHNPPHVKIPKEHGQSSSKKAKDGVVVVFDGVFSDVPEMSLCPWQKGSVWLTEVTATGFTWKSDKKTAMIDWIAVGEV